MIFFEFLSKTSRIRRSRKSRSRRLKRTPIAAALSRPLSFTVVSLALLGSLITLSDLLPNSILHSATYAQSDVPNNTEDETEPEKKEREVDPAILEALRKIREKRQQEETENETPDQPEPQTSPALEPESESESASEADTTETTEPTEPLASPNAQPLTTRELAKHLLLRTSFGPTPGEVDAMTDLIERRGYRAAVDAIIDQAKPHRPDDATLSMITERWPSLLMDMGQINDNYRPPYPRGEVTPQRRLEFIRQVNRMRYQVGRELRESVLVRAVKSEQPFREVMVEFWRNHFNVDQNKDDVGYYANHYEEQVIRRHAFGEFGNMLLASAQHPAMLIYLDNHISQKPLTKHEERLLARYDDAEVKPSSVAALQRHRGLNENYARELMELHTLGVDRLYTQRDVIELARVLTGWTVGSSERGTSMTMMTGGRAGDYGFHFNAEAHDTGSKVVLGRRIRGTSNPHDGLAVGIDVVRSLANHKETAEYISFKLCRYLIGDEPSAELVYDISRIYRRSDGDLEDIYRAILMSDEFISRASYRSKFRTPFEFVVAALRATGAQIQNPGPTLEALESMGQPIYGCEDPIGYEDQAEAWLDPGVLVYRWMFALDLANNEVRGVRIDPELYNGFDGMPRDERTTQLAQRLLGKPLDERNQRIVNQQGNIRRAAGLILGSPQFQQQ